MSLFPVIGRVNDGTTFYLRQEPDDERQARIDEFAKAALTGLLANPKFVDDDGDSWMSYADFARQSFEQSHAMEAERERRMKGDD